jgi:hypothetical protein
MLLYFCPRSKVYFTSQPVTGLPSCQRAAGFNTTSIASSVTAYDSASSGSSFPLSGLNTNSVSYTSTFAP